MSGLTAARGGAVELRMEERRLPAIGMRYVFASAAAGPVERVVVAVHGVSREWREIARQFAARCCAANSALVVPRFSRSGYRGYQRLEAGRKKLAADSALLRVLDDAGERFGIGGTEDLRLFGYSGGAQFVHRFSLRHRKLVERQALAAAGFYTMPDAELAFPYGLAEGPRRDALDPDGLTIPTKVFVGDLDVRRDAQLRTGGAVDRQQGLNRLERARRFVAAVRTFAGARGLVPACSLEILRGCDHSFINSAVQGDLARKAVDFLVPEATEHPQLLPPPPLNALRPRLDPTRR